MTGPQGGSWYPMGGAIKNVVDAAMPDSSVQVMPGAGIANVKAIEAGKADLAFANSVSTVDAINGQPPFEEAVDQRLPHCDPLSAVLSGRDHRGYRHRKPGSAQGPWAHHAARRQHR